MTLRILLAAALAVALGAGTMAALLSRQPSAERAQAGKADALPAHRDGAQGIRTIPITRDRPLTLAPGLAPEPPLPKETDRVPQAAPQVAAAAPQAPPPAITAEPEPAVNHVSRETGDRRHAGDICARTGGWRVTLRGGRSWRCAYR